MHSLELSCLERTETLGKSLGTVAAPGDVITARMNVKFFDNGEVEGAPRGTIAYDVFTRRKDFCRGKTSMVQVERGAAGTEFENTWTVSGDAAGACVTGSDGYGPSIVHLPFEMTATVIWPENPDEPACE